MLQKTLDSQSHSQLLVLGDHLLGQLRALLSTSLDRLQASRRIGADRLLVLQLLHVKLLDQMHANRCNAKCREGQMQGIRSEHARMQGAG